MSLRISESALSGPPSSGSLRPTGRCGGISSRLRRPSSGPPRPPPRRRGAMYNKYLCICEDTCGRPVGNGIGADICGRAGVRDTSAFAPPSSRVSVHWCRRRRRAFLRASLAAGALARGPRPGPHLCRPGVHPRRGRGPAQRPGPAPPLPPGAAAPVRPRGGARAQQSRTPQSRQSRGQRPAPPLGNTGQAPAAENQMHAAEDRAITPKRVLRR